MVMMKCKLASRILAFALASALLVGTAAGVPVSAADTSGMAAANLSEGDDYINVAGLNVSKETLVKLSEIGDVPGLSFGTSLLLDNVWGGDSSSDDLLNYMDQQFAEITDKLDDISAQITDLSNQLSNESEKNMLQNRINAYQEYITAYETYAKGFAGDLERADAVTDEAARKAAQQQFLKNVYNSDCGGHGAFTEAVIMLGHRITDKSYTGNLDLLSTFDELARYTYKWEYQGYDDRVRFQADVIGLYTYLAAIDKLALAQAIQDNLPVNESCISAQTELKDLDDMTKTVSDLAQEKTIVRRPSYLRYYQVPGHECLLYETGQAGWLEDQTFKSTKDAKNYFNNLLTINSLGIKAELPSAAWLKQVYDDYGGSKSLNQIFFGEDCGNINLGANWSTVNFIKPAFATTDRRVLIPGLEIEDMLVDFSGNALTSFTLLMDPAVVFGDNKWKRMVDYEEIIDLAVVHQGVTPVDYVPSTVPEATAIRQPSSSSSQSSSSSSVTEDTTSSQTASSQTSSSAVSNPKTGDDGMPIFPAGIAVISSAAALFFLVFQKKHPHTNR